MVQLLHGDSINHGHSAVVVLEYNHQVKVFEMELDTLKVDQLYFIQADHKWWL